MELLALGKVMSCPIILLSMSVLHDLDQFWSCWIFWERCSLVIHRRGDGEQQYLLCCLLSFWGNIIPKVIKNSLIDSYWVNNIWSFKPRGQATATCQNLYPMVCLKRGWGFPQCQPYLIPDVSLLQWKTVIIFLHTARNGLSNILFTTTLGLRGGNSFEEQDDLLNWISLATHLFKRSINYLHWIQENVLLSRKGRVSCLEKQGFVNQEKAGRNRWTGHCYIIMKERASYYTNAMNLRRMLYPTVSISKDRGGDSGLQIFIYRSFPDYLEVSTWAHWER